MSHSQRPKNKPILHGEGLGKLADEIFAREPEAEASPAELLEIRGISRHAAERYLEYFEHIRNPSAEQITAIERKLLDRYRKRRWTYGGKATQGKSIYYCSDRHILLSYDLEVVTIYDTGIPINRCGCPLCRKRRAKNKK